MTTSGDESLSDDELDTTAGGSDAVPAGTPTAPTAPRATATPPTPTPPTEPTATAPTLTAPTVAPATPTAPTAITTAPTVAAASRDQHLVSALELLSGDAQNFVEKIWASHVHVHQADPADLVGLLSFDDVDQLLTSTAIRTPAVRLAKDGSVLPGFGATPAAAPPWPASR